MGHFKKRWISEKRSRILLCVLAYGALWIVGCDQDFGDPGVSSNLDADGKAKSVYEGNHFAVVKPGEQVAYNQREVMLHRGKEIYNLYCVGCHGVYGDGEGTAAVRLQTKPRDFTSGIYKFRSTDSSSLPMESDLHRTISRGLATVSMPEFALMPEPDKAAVIEYIKAFYPKWDEEAATRVKIHVPVAPVDMRDADRISRGRVVYLGAQCFVCHGTDGGGRGATQVYYKDAWGDLQRPLDFTRSKLKAGDDPEDIYRTFMTGLKSIMPAYNGKIFGGIHSAGVEEVMDSRGLSVEKKAYAKALKEFPVDVEAFEKLSPEEKAEIGLRNTWDLVAYVMSLREKKEVKKSVPVKVETDEENDGEK